MQKEILDDLIKDCYCQRNGGKDKWCFIREIIGSFGLSDRNIEQLRLVYDYKFMKSKERGEDIGKECALREFIELYGKKFADVYQEGMKHDSLFKLVFGIERVHTDEDIHKNFLR